jgi:ribosomal protein S18 acetylase RimI-like enzyme
MQTRPEIRSLGFRTDLALLTASGSTVEDRGTHLVVRTPDNPTYFWGNFLLLRDLPVPGGEREVVGAFGTEFPDAEHVALGVDGTAAYDDHALQPFVDAGLSVDVSVVLTTGAVPEPRPPAVDAEVRPLAGDEEWEARARLSQVLHPSVDEETFQAFARRKNGQEQALVAAGAGRRYGAFVDGTLVATAGVFRTAEEVARFQAVETLPDHRRRGLATAVVHAAARHALDELGATTLVIVADPDAEAVGLYRGLGFTGGERQTQLFRAPVDWPDA